MTFNRVRGRLLTLAFAALAAAAGCAQVVEVGPPPGTCDLACLTEKGWESYEAGRWTEFSYFASATYVDSTFGEAFMGLGYFQIELGFVGAASESFQRAVDLDTSLVAAYAGNSFCLATLGDEGGALVMASEALDRAGPDFVFEHNETVSGRSLLLLIASISFRNGDYVTAQAQVDQVFPGNGLDPGSRDYVRSLMVVIATLIEQPS